MNGDSNQTVKLNRCVELELVYADGEEEVKVFDLVKEDQADYYNGFLGVTTALGKAILSHRVGEVIPYEAGDIREVRIVSVCDSIRSSPNRAEERQRVIQKAVAESELKNRIAVATSVDNKWGDYDPAGLQRTLDEKDQKGGEQAENSEVES